MNSTTTEETAAKAAETEAPQTTETQEPAIPMDVELNEVLATILQEVADNQEEADPQQRAIYMRSLERLGRAYSELGALLGIPVLVHQFVPLALLRSTHYMGEETTAALEAQIKESETGLDWLEWHSHSYEVVSKTPEEVSNFFKGVESFSRYKAEECSANGK